MRLNPNKKYNRELFTKACMIVYPWLHNSLKHDNIHYNTYIDNWLNSDHAHVDHDSNLIKVYNKLEADYIFNATFDSLLKDNK